MLAGLLAGGIGLPSGAAAQDGKSRSLRPCPSKARCPRSTARAGWLNTPPLTAAGLRGKVVLVDFWTYSCINWLRTLPHVRAWAEKYKSQGLVVIGVHSPEFEFEKNVDNVRQAVKDMRVDYPVAIDSEHAVWRAFGNQYWPAIYLVDAQGRIRHHHFGEGGYERTERVIQQLLAEAGAGAERRQAGCRGCPRRGDRGRLGAPEVSGDLHRPCACRAIRFARPRARRKACRPRPSRRFRLNDWALSGNWTRQGSSPRSNAPGGRIAYRFHARDLHLVMGPATRGTAVRFRVLIDGQAPRGDHGIDVDEQGMGTVTEQRLYQLVRQKGPIADRQFEIEFLDPGVEAYVFTFG